MKTVRYSARMVRWLFSDETGAAEARAVATAREYRELWKLAHVRGIIGGSHRT